jgi:hypothetical protein
MGRGKRGAALGFDAGNARNLSIYRRNSEESSELNSRQRCYNCCYSRWFNSWLSHISVVESVATAARVGEEPNAGDEMQKGDKVVCINDKWEPWVFDTYNQLPKKGEIYTIRAVRPGRPNLSGGAAVLTVLLEELQNDVDFTHVGGDELGFRASRFAPLESERGRAAARQEVVAPREQEEVVIYRN